MEVILKQDVEKLGRQGAMVKVKDGYARNFLFPKNLAVRKTERNIKRLEDEKRRKELEIEKVKKEYFDLKEKLDNLSLTIPVLVQEDDRFYAGIGALDISNALTEEGFQIDKSSIILDEPIRALGIYEVNIRLHPEIIANVKVWIVKK